MGALNYITGNLLHASRPAILAHACNTHGIWGGGIAYQIALQFPAAEARYEDHCARHSPEQLIGTTFLIETQKDEPGNKGSDDPYIIACLFTSVGGGGFADAPAEIVKNTRLALEDLERQLKETSSEVLLGLKKVRGHWVVDLPKINAGIFRVPWDETEAVLKESGLDYNVYIV
ncbi:CYFA0S04e04544g1_1 [Cyberlindnera fabianii]|uniref:ADP-ribose 1''-phosphate phosphatase n=1 Tax=Cyberlindnera fabianii TaxID=36022 RepID=A0A061ASK4_CYBFA|nr:ADP-ribose 1''-phosphate phosphatase [Cyberlindnera fabianii]CDR40145.1 CYFA0S04e04544g1_1 [Cyberlindnera fabianii]